MTQGVWNSLSGIKVLEVGQYVAGPYAASVLSYFGADVTKIEPLGGDAARIFKPEILGNIGAPFATLNVNKHYLAINLKHPDAGKITEHLIGECDVLIQNLRPGDAEKYGFGSSRVHAINPRVIHCSISAFYATDSIRPGYDVLVQAESGIMSINGEPDGGPCRVPLPMLDYTTGLWAAMAVATATRGERDCVTIRVSLQDVAMGLMSDHVVAYLGGAAPPQRRGSATELMTPHGAYTTADGYILLTAGTDHLFVKLARALGPPVDEERFQTGPSRLRLRSDLDQAINEILSSQKSSYWYGALSDAGVPVAIIREFDDAVARHTEESRTGVRPVGKAVVMAPPIEVVGVPWELPSLPGEVGRDTDGILGSLGLSQSEIEAFRKEGLIL
jgi:CoA:oxalate CoA-transferase